MKSPVWLMLVTSFFILIGSNIGGSFIIPAEKAKTGKEIIIVYQVKRGDSLEWIAKFYGVKMERIRKRNKIKNPNKIYVGQILKIPTGLYWGKIIYHKVKREEAVLEIARKYSAFPEQIFHDNNLNPRSLIYPGQILKVAKVKIPPQRIMVSWYGEDFHGKKTANGERYNMNGFTAAHRWWPLEMRVRVTYGRKSIFVKINDRGPYHLERQLDLSYRSVSALGGTDLIRKGKFFVTVSEN